MLKNQDKLTFCPENNDGGWGDYEICWETGTKHIVVLRRALAINEGGVIHLIDVNMRDPNERAYTCKQWGIDIMLRDDTPDVHNGDGKKLPRNALRDRAYLVQDGRMYTVDQHQSLPGMGWVYAKWYHPDGLPTVFSQTTTRERNVEREKEWLKPRAELFMRCKGAYLLVDKEDRKSVSKNFHYEKVTTMLRTITLPTEDVAETLEQAGMWITENAPSGYREFFLSQTADVRTYDYLHVL